MKLLIIAIVLFLTACGGEEPTNPHLFWPEDCQSETVFIGDSITYHWPEEFRPSGCNYGVPGATSYDWLGWDVEAEHAYILLGVNDFRDGNSVESVYENIMVIAERYEHVTLISVLPTSSHSVNVLATDLNNNLAVSGYDFIDLSYFDPALTYDGLHPSYEGYETISY